MEFFSCSRLAVSGCSEEQSEATCSRKSKVTVVSLLLVLSAIEIKH